MSTHIGTVAGTGSTPRPPTQRSPYRAAWLAVGGALTVIVILLTGLNVVGWLARQTATETHSYPAVSTINIESGSGDIKVMPGGGDRITVERHVTWSYTRPDLSEKVEGDTLRVSSSCRFLLIPQCSTDYVVRVPANITVFAKSSSGNVSVTGVDGDVQAKASSGDVRVEDIGGDVTLKSSSGDIRAVRVRGHLQVNASSGDIRASELESSTVETRVSSGNTTLSFATAPQRVSAHGASGDVKVLVPGRDAYRTEVHTSSGDETVRIVQDPDASRSITIDVSSGDATIRYL